MATRETGTARNGRTGRPARRAVEIPETLTVRQLADLLGVSPVEVIKQLMRAGIMASINQPVEFETAALVAAGFGFVPRRKRAEEGKAIALVRRLLAEEEDPSRLKPRPPVITVLGHVDHGKTTLLDRIRHTNVAEQEAGGITQHIGAYQVEVNGQRITFLDTPGHEAFTALRARGAQVTDIAVLVVAADDGVMPQTVEAVNHARAAGVPIVVAINKIDKPGADPERVKRQLAELGLVPEEWGGETITVPISAKTGEGVQDLLENLLVLAEILELKANPDRPATGTVIEARLDRNRGPVGTLLVQQGTLRVGDVVVAGTVWGKVKAMLDWQGRRVREAGPSTPVEVLGFQEVPTAGEIFVVVPDEETAKEVVEERRQGHAEERLRARPLSLEEVRARMEAGELKALNLILKCDVQGSVEAVRNALQKLETEQVQIHILHAGVGGITEGDVLLASASGAVIIGFNTRVEPGAKRLAEQEGVQIRLYTVIYQLIEDVERALKGMLGPRVQEVYLGRAEVRAVFPVGHRGEKVAGCLVVDGRVARGAGVRVVRRGKVVHEGTIASLRRYKDDVREVPAGTECGVGVEGFYDFEVGDILEVFRREVVGRA